MNTYTLPTSSTGAIKQDLQTAYTKARTITGKIKKPNFSRLQAIGLRTYFIIYEVLVIIYS